MARKAGAIALGFALACVPAAGGAKPAKRVAHVLHAAPSEAPFGAFTPAAADPRMAAALARSGLGADSLTGGAFRFTPAGADSRRAVTVAVRARAVSRNDVARQVASTVPAALASSAYSLGASVNWRRFAVSGDVTKITPGLLPEGREAADIGLTYSGNRWATKLELAADRAADRNALFGLDQSWSVDVGGSYAVTRNLNVTGGVRYKERRDRFNAPVSGDATRESQAIYLGTAFRF